MVFIFVVIGLIGLMILSEGVTTFARNENSPVLTEKARLIKKTGSTVVDANGAAATTLILQFEIDGTVLKCAVNGLKAASSGFFVCFKKCEHSFSFYFQ